MRAIRIALIAASLGSCAQPQFPHAQLGPISLCTSLRIYDNVLRGQVVDWGKPVARTNSLFPCAGSAWYTPLTFEVESRFRGTSSQRITVYMPMAVSDLGDIATGISFGARTDSTRPSSWLFARSTDGSFWSGAGDISVIVDGGVYFPGPDSSWPTEEKFLRELELTEPQPICALSKAETIGRPLGECDTPWPANVDMVSDGGDGG